MEKLTWGKRVRGWGWWWWTVVLCAEIGVIWCIHLLPDASELHPATLVLASQVCDRAQAAGWEDVCWGNTCEVKTSYRTGSRFVTLLRHDSTMKSPYVPVYGILEER